MGKISTRSRVMKTDFPDCPDGRKDCVFSRGVRSTTLAYCPPQYDRGGNNLNPDSNVTSGKLTCETCGRIWNYSEQYGKPFFMPEVQNDGR
jgi:hypothetical protein